MLGFSTLLVSAAAIYVCAEFDYYIKVGRMEVNRTIRFENGTLWTVKLKENVKVYGRNKAPTGNEIFECIYVEQPNYNTIEEKTGCIAAQLLNVDEKASCNSITFSYGITSREKSDFCWVAESGMTCAISALIRDSDAVVPLFETLEGHSNRFANCASQQFLTRFASTRDDVTSGSRRTLFGKGGTSQNSDYFNGKRRRLIMRNETARMLAMIGAAGSLLLVVQCSVLLLLINLVKNEGFRED